MSESPARRQKELAAIHVGKKKLAWDDPIYRTVIGRISGGRTQSAGDLNEAERRALLEEMREKGFKPRSKPDHPRRAGRRPLAPGEQQAKIRALWLSLYHLGEVADPAESAIDAYCKRMAGVHSARWLDGQAANKVIGGLRGWCERVGFGLPHASDLDDIWRWREAAGLPMEGIDLGFAAKVALIRCQWDRLVALGAFRRGTEARLETWLRKEADVSAPHFLDREDADRVVERLGAWVRKTKRGSAATRAEPGRP